MKVAHLSDLHLGYGEGTGGGCGRGCGQRPDRGRGRTGDTARAFRQAFEQIAELRPQLVVVAGDVFDHPGVSGSAIAAFRETTADLIDRLPDVVVAVAAGARDTPLNPEHRGPLGLTDAPESVEVACTSARRVRVADGALSVTLVPHRAVAAAGSATAATPDPRAKWNVLVVHAALADAKSSAPALHAAGWDYVALGSSHVRRRILDRVHYSGSLERVGPDPWLNAAHDKGFLLVRLGAGEANLCPVQARTAVSLAPAVGLAPVRGTKPGVQAVARRLAEAIDGVTGGVDGKLLRVPVVGLSEDDLARLDRDVLGPVRRRVADLDVQTTTGSTAKTSAPASRAASKASVPIQRAASKARGPAAIAVPFAGAPLVLEQLGRALGASGRELADARGVVAFVSDGDALLDAASSALAHADSADLFATLWSGAGSVDQWQSTGAKLIHAQGPAEPCQTAEGHVAVDPEAQLRSLREQAAEAKGDLEAGMVAWVRERQDAETRLLLYRDRGRELKARLAEIDEGGPDAPCGACGRSLGSRFDKVRTARRQEWEDMVRDGRWWRRRRDQLEFKPASLRMTEARSLKLAAAAADLSETAPPDASPAKPDKARPDADAPAREQYRALVHARTMSLTGGRLAGTFPALYAEWEEGRRRDGRDVSALELAARVVMAELATDAGLGLDSVVVPAGLDRLAPEDLPRALLALSRLARRIPLVIVGARKDVACTAPELFNLLYWTEDTSDGPRLRHRRLGLGAIRLQGG